MFEKLKNYAAKQLELDASEITPDSTFESLGIDSLDVVEMIMDLESNGGDRVSTRRFVEHGGNGGIEQVVCDDRALGKG